MPTPNVPDPLTARFAQDLTALAGPLASGTKIGLAVSGGPDSIALLLLADAAFPGRFIVATVDHGLRPEAAAEAAQVGRICAGKNIRHTILDRSNLTEYEADLADQPQDRKESGGNGGNAQHKARMLRYRLLGQWAATEGLSHVATAHHRDDVAESFVMRALRGSGSGGLARMRAVTPMPYTPDTETLLIRPLLGWSRAELAGIVSDAGLPIVQDPSNDDPRYDRARVRAVLRRETMLDPEALSRAAANLADTEAALEWMTEQAWRSRVRVQDADAVQLDPGDLPTEIRRRLTARAIAALSPGWKGDGLEPMLAQLEAEKSATLAGVKATGGALWRFDIAPAHSGHR
ncbi:MAG: tRNA lysidine(34) synthetase TilS [Sphingomonadaceae bacterium]